MLPAFVCYFDHEVSIGNQMDNRCAEADVDGDKIINWGNTMSERLCL